MGVLPSTGARPIGENTTDLHLSILKPYPCPWPRKVDEQRVVRFPGDVVGLLPHRGRVPRPSFGLFVFAAQAAGSLVLLQDNATDRRVKPRGGSGHVRQDLRSAMFAELLHLMQSQEVLKVNRHNQVVASRLQTGIKVLVSSTERDPQGTPLGPIVAHTVDYAETLAAHDVDGLLTTGMLTRVPARRNLGDHAHRPHVLKPVSGATRRPTLASCRFVTHWISSS